MDFFLHIGLIAVIIPIIFFTYGLKLQHKVVNNEISKVLHDALMPYMALVTKGMTTVEVQEVTKSISEKQLESNAKIRKKAYTYLGLLFGFCIFMFLCLCVLAGTFPVQVIIENLILVTFVGLTEIVFFTFIAANYRPINLEKIRVEVAKPYGGC